ncbi:MAG: biotin--[acetyl-CoA-carboxylase] ligase [Chloroflexota bacterium]
MESDLTTTAVLTQLNTTWLGRSYQHFERLGSTNDYLKQNSHLPAGTVVVTDFQETGRGRFNRVWQAPPGSSLLMSLLLRPQWEVEKLVWIGMAAGLAGTEAIRQTAGITARLKWPNDLVIEQDNQWCKVSGLLMETHWVPERPFPDIVVGMGLNVNIEATDLPTAVTPATSLKVAAGRAISRRDLLCTFLEQFESWFEAIEGGKSPHEAWEKELITVGQAVKVTAVRDNSSFSGIAEGTTEWGHLRVRDQSGNIHTVAAGDVTLRK